MNPYLDIQDITKSIGDLVLFEGISFSIAEGQHVGLIARNGTGKSTLLNIITGKDSPDSGSVVFRKELRIGFLEQTPYLNPEMSVLQAVCSRLQPEVASSFYCLDGTTLMAHGECCDDWSEVEQRARRILSQLKIKDFNQKIGVLSGGQQKRVALASVLIENPDLLILDEPTNHLDLGMIEWLEKYLQRNTKALLLVTHDRYFLDNVCSSIIELEDKNLYVYKGNYKYYLEKREERLFALNANIEKARNLYRKELDWMRRMPCARGHKAKYRKDAFYELQQQAHRRIEERAARLEVKCGYVGSKIFEAEYVSKKFENGPTILKDFYYNFGRFEKMGIVGENGTGKSTFVKMLLGEISPDSGRFVIGETVNIGYFSQEGMAFDMQMKVIDAVRRIAETIDLGGGRKMTASQFLTHFLFPPARQQNFIYKLSGGERRRLYLCTVLMRNPNFLILDEPTNDLDIVTLQLLEDYLIDFRGPVIIVSHDRYFMDKVVDHLLVFKGDGVIDDFPGNYTQYREWCSLKEKEEEVEKKESRAKLANNTKDANKDKQKRKLSFKERREYEQLEDEIAQLEQKKADMTKALCSGELPVAELIELSKNLPLIEAEIEEKSLRWFELAEIENNS